MRFYKIKEEGSGRGFHIISFNPTCKERLVKKFMLIKEFTSWYFYKWLIRGLIIYRYRLLFIIPWWIHNMFEILRLTIVFGCFSEKNELFFQFRKCFINLQGILSSCSFYTLSLQTLHQNVMFNQSYTRSDID